MTFTYSSVVPDHRAEEAGRYMQTHPVPYQQPGRNITDCADVDVINFCRALRIGETTWGEYRRAGQKWLKAHDPRAAATIEAWKRSGLTTSTHAHHSKPHVSYVY